ncbi:iron-siderophore ABC transporter substrate-binding protein [Skermanella rosea]|uniref:iron-siderophore ABC transporter substrate-binding protein n=1 Tax=Skermanella rosea TaxID=1817965 RepID=UPI001931BF6A|nr:iron-siderophore ABC transporter substrate-binding protein [Skermanella rosea]UEM03208.1 iron-siderophore ABC transporter substrate-binding protein [Skermanella rosea]
MKGADGQASPPSPPPALRLRILGSLLAPLAVLAILAATAAAAGDTPPPPRRVVALDWGLTDTLIALGIRPLAVPEAKVYETWVGGPPLDPGVVDLGLRLEPNLELLSTLAPDLILIVGEQESLRPQLERIAPTLSLPTYTSDHRPWENAVDATRRLSRLLHRQAAGEALIGRAEAAFAAAQVTLEAANPPPVLAVSFMDARHVRVYGKGSLAEAVLESSGLRSAWTGPTNAWGFATVPIDRLSVHPDASLLVIDPVPPDARPTLASSPLWRNLPAVAAGRTGVIPPPLVFGMVPAAARFARMLAETPDLFPAAPLSGPRSYGDAGSAGRPR